LSGWSRCSEAAAGERLTADGLRVDCGEPLFGGGERVPLTRKNWLLKKSFRRLIINILDGLVQRTTHLPEHRIRLTTTFVISIPLKVKFNFT